MIGILVSIVLQLPRRLAAAILLVAVAWNAPSDADAKVVNLEAQRDGSFITKSIEAKFENIGQLEKAKEIWWEEIDLEDQKTDYVRLRISPFAAWDGEFSIVLTTQSDSFRKVVHSTDLQPNRDFWSPLIPGNFVHVSVQTKTPVKAGFQISGVVFQSRTITPESITKPDCRQHVGDFTDGETAWTPYSPKCLEFVPDGFNNAAALWRNQSSVAKLSFVVNDKPYVCTGFMISDSRMITNHHCIPNDDICATATAIFGLQYVRVTTTPPRFELSRGKQYSCKKIVKKSYDFDFALLEINGNPGVEYGYLRWSDVALTDDTPIYILQHPAGQRKQVSLIGCKVIKAVEEGRTDYSDLSHSCDTIGGSSGSPVFNYEGNVIGLHHYGFGEGSAHWNANRAVRAEEIRKLIN